VGEHDALRAAIVGVRLALDIAQTLEVVDQLPDRLRGDVRPRCDRRQPGAASMSMCAMTDECAGRLGKPAALTPSTIQLTASKVDAEPDCRQEEG
jgi:hypothetical protein